MASKLSRKCSFCFMTARRLRNLTPHVSRVYHSNNNGNNHAADVVISGGGMVGAAMACALGHESLLQNKKIVLLEAAPRKAFKFSERYNNRTCTLSPASIQLFEKCGAWQEITGMRCHKVLRMQIWEACSNSLISFNQDDMAAELAYVAENDIILESLTRRLDAIRDRVHVMYGTSAEQIQLPGVDKDLESNSWVKIKLNNGQTLKTKLLIGSDGMNSMVRKVAKFETVQYDYKQEAVVAVLNISKCDNTVAWQRFLPTGPIAMLPLSDTAISLIWTTTPDDAKVLKSLSGERFIDAVNDAFWHEREINVVAEQALGTFQKLLNFVLPDSTSIRQLPPTVTGIQTGSRASFPLGLTHSSNYIRHRVAVIGDAAHRLHPLAGQGVNLGFGDVMKLTEVLAKAAVNGSDLGSMAYLKEYETSRQCKVLPVLVTIDGLQKLYSNDITPLVVLRSLGLQTTNALKPLKGLIMQQASK